MGANILLLKIFLVFLLHGDICVGKSINLDYKVISSKQHDYSLGWTKPNGAILFSAGTLKAYNDSNKWSYCKENQFARGLAIPVEVNLPENPVGKIELICESQPSSSSFLKCKEEEVLIGFQTKSTAGVQEEIRLQCYGSVSGKTWVGLPGGNRSLGWKPIKSCPSGQAICGIWNHIHNDELAVQCCTFKHSSIWRIKESRSESSKYIKVKLIPRVVEKRPLSSGPESDTEQSCKRRRINQAQLGSSKKPPSFGTHRVCAKDSSLYKDWEKIPDPAVRINAFDEKGEPILYRTMKPRLNAYSNFESIAVGDFREAAENVNPVRYNLLREKYGVEGLGGVRLKQIDIVTSTMEKVTTGSDFPNNFKPTALFIKGTNATGASRSATRHNGYDPRDGEHFYIAKDTTKSKNKFATDEAGHLLPRIFGGLGHIPDLTLPMDKITNLDMREIDRKILKQAGRDCVGAGITCDLEVSIKPFYEDANYQKRPTRMLMRYRFIVKTGNVHDIRNFKSFEIDNSFDIKRYKQTQDTETKESVKLFILLSTLV